jgi:Transposase DDE domain
MFIIRKKKLTATNFLNTLMFSVTSPLNTSLPDISDDLDQHFGVEISKVALHEKFNDKAVNFLKEVLKLQLSKQLTLVEDNELKGFFSAINIKDSTKFSLPSDYDDSYPGFGNYHKKDGLMNIQYEYELISGNWNSLELTKSTRNDQTESKETIDKIKTGELYLRDLGYITPTYLNAIVNEEAYFFNRLPSIINVYKVNNKLIDDCKEKLIDWKKVNRYFNIHGAESMEMEVKIYEKERIPCRLIIEKVPEEEYKKRLKKAEEKAKSSNNGISDRHKIRLRYNTYITNVSKEILPYKKIRKTYYLRWQVELVFKTWKSFFEINKIKKVKKERMECQLLAKLIWILLNWRLFQICNHHLKVIKAGIGMSIIKFFKRCVKYSESLRKVILEKLSVSQWLIEDFLPLVDNAFCEAPKHKQTHYEVLNNLQYA